MRKSNYIQTPRARKLKGHTVRVGGIVTIKSAGKSALKFRKGALHRHLGVPQGVKIPENKKVAALAGKYGEKVRREANFAFRGALKAGRDTHRKLMGGK